MSSGRIIIGIDPGYSRTGIVAFDDNDLLLACSIYSLKSKNIIKVRCNVEYSCIGLIDYFKDIYFECEDKVGDGERLKLYFILFKEIYKNIININRDTLYTTVIFGIEVPMGSHLGNGAKIDRIYTTILLAANSFIDSYVELSNLFINSRINLYTPSMIKKFVVNNGKAKKELIMKEVYKKWGFETEFNDVADAYAISKLVIKNCI